MISAIVVQLSPLLITIPPLTGKGTVSAVLLQPAAPPAVGDAVWVDQVNGFPGWLVVNVPIGSGPTGPAGAGWSSGAAVPTAAPASNQVFYLRTTTSDVYLWGGASWSIIANLKGTAGTTGNGWSSGTAIPAGAPISNQIYYHHTPTGDIYTWSGTSWSITSNIKGAAGAAGTVGPVGAIMAFGGSNSPSGWLYCDGSAIPRTVYAALFAAIGTTHGAGDGSTTFNLPNLVGRVIVGQNIADSDFQASGQVGGSKTHSHALGDAGQAQIYTTTGGVIGMRRVNTAAYTETLEFTATRTSGAAASQTLGAALAGATNAASTVQPYMALFYVIKY